MSQQLLNFDCWEKPREIAALEGERKNCQTLQLNSLGEPARKIFT
ncbi:hypothetical protein QUA80_31910 [Microcoleus sp. F4-D5]